MKNWNYINGAQIGNARYTTREDVISHLDTDLYDICKKVPAGSPSFAYVSELQKKGWDISTISKYTKEIGKIIDKYAKVGNSTEKLFYGLSKDAEKEEEKSDEDLDELKKTENEKAISSTFNINDYGVEVGQWSWDWRGKAPDENKQKEIERKIKSYVQQINKNVPAGDNDERDAVFSQLDKFVRAQGLNKKVGNSKVGNFKTGKSALKPGDRVQSYGVQGTVRKVEGENSDNIYGEPIIEVEWDNGTVKKVGEHYLRKIGNKVGNRIIEKESEMGYELKNLLKNAPEWIKEKIRFAFSHGFTIDENDFINAIKKEANLSKVGNSLVGNADTVSEYNAEIQRLTRKAEQLRRMGQGKQAMEVEKQIEKLGKELHEYTKTGNSDNMKSYKEVLEKAKQELERIKQKEKEADSYAKKQELASARRDVEDKIKYYQSHIGNSASDDKFAYVMREFDEGKLKTPDGKVVTDPAQAKAIAYSESKKTENGLARARNAMKCGNSQITLWKGNDSALLSDDGLVQYLENNAFETDRDKYDSQQTAIEELKKLGYRKK